MNKGIELVSWIRDDEKKAEEEGRTSMREVMGFFYSDWDLLCGDWSYADKQLTDAGLLASPANRTSFCKTWKTVLGQKVAAALDFRPPE